MREREASSGEGPEGKIAIKTQESQLARLGAKLWLAAITPN